MENNLIYKSNHIIEASYSLTLNEQRLLLSCISQIKSDEDFDVKEGFVLTVEQAQDLFYQKSERNNAFRDLKIATEKLFDRKIRMFSENGRHEMITRWISTAKFDYDNQQAILYFHDQIKPYLCQLKENFTKYRLKNITQLTSIYAIRLYELIVGWSFNTSYKEITIDEIRELLELGSKYRQFGELNKRVITPAEEQINEFTDFELEIKYKKRRRSYHLIQLRFNKKQEAQVIENAQSRKATHNLTQQEKSKQEAILAKRKQDFDTFKESLTITPDMQFKNVKTNEIYTVNENCCIDTHDFQQFNKYFINSEQIKRAIFDKLIFQITNEEDTLTKGFDF